MYIEIFYGAIKERPQAAQKWKGKGFLVLDPQKWSTLGPVFKSAINNLGTNSHGQWRKLNNLEAGQEHKNLN